jgi:hypothetical protein
MNPWKAYALNTAPDSENQIHSDDLAKRYGFKGGLVPGVTVSAYLLHPVIESSGMAWLEKGYANCKITSPLYDGENFEVISEIPREGQTNTFLKNEDGKIIANAESKILENIPSKPKYRGDLLIQEEFKAPIASFAEWKKLKKEGCKAFKFHWGGDNPLIYLSDEKKLPLILQPSKSGHANLSFLLGCANWILAGNAFMNPWVHLETKSQNYKAVSIETTLIAEMSVIDFYEKKGHEFIEVEVNLFEEKSKQCCMSINQLAIFKLRN